MTNRTAEQDFASWREHDDVAALGRVFDRLAPELLVVAAHVAGRGSAEDLLQGTFLAAVQHARRWQPSRPLLPWLVGILINLARRERARQRRPLDPARLPRRAADEPHRAAADAELAQVLADTLHRLPRPYRQALTLRLVHGLEPTAIAHALGCPPATAKSRVQRGLELLRRALPAGFRLPAIVLAPSLGAVRATLLEHAAARGVAHGLGLLTTGLALGGSLLMNKIACAAGMAALAALLVAASWVALAPSATPAVAGTDAPHALVAPQAQAPEATASQSSRSQPAVGTPPPARTPLAAERTATAIAGHVVDERGQALEGVAVLLGLPGRNEIFRGLADALLHLGADPDVARTNGPIQGGVVTHTDAAGKFRFDAPGDDLRRRLVAWSAARGCALAPLADGAPAPSLEIVLCQGTRIRGTLRTPSAMPLAGAHVSICRESTSVFFAEIDTDAHGGFATPPLPPDVYWVLGSHNAHASAWTTVRIGSGDADRLVDLQRAPLPILRTILVAAGGEPWTAARIESATGVEAAELSFLLTAKSFAQRTAIDVEGWPLRLSYAPESGVLEGALRDPSARVLSVWRERTKLGETTLPSPLPDRATIALALREKTIDLHVRVRLEPPPPAPLDIRVTLAERKGELAMGLAPLHVVRTRASDCVLAVPERLAGGTCDVVVSAKGFGERCSAVAIPAKSETVWHEIVLTPATQTVQGLVLGPDGKPPSRAVILVATTDGSFLRTPEHSAALAEDSGRFRFDELPLGRLLLLARAEGLAARAVMVDTAAGGVQRIELRAGRTVAIDWREGAVQFRVLDAAGGLLDDDRLGGSMRYGPQWKLLVDPDAAVVEAWDGASRQCLARGEVPAGGELTLIPRR